MCGCGDVWFLCWFVVFVSCSCCGAVILPFWFSGFSNHLLWLIGVVAGVGYEVGLVVVGCLVAVMCFVF